MPCDYKLYPKNWKTWIVPEIRSRSGNKCEWCDVKNNSIVERKTTVGTHLAKIILTVAHLNHDLKSNDGMDSGCKALLLENANLVHLCQKCHNGHDAQHRANNRKKKR